MLKAVKASIEFFDRFGRVVEEIEGENLSVDLIRKLRDTEFYYSGYLTLYSNDGNSRMYFDDTMPELIHTLNNLLEEMEVAHA
ncbi:hypothetical protein [Escherichia coli]|uniref:hypothetical protein n=1 Tax=Escherichia coli TaxID=562 RepID=UPI000F055DA0|nr:hypothetical protein [Escherichia coli]